MHRWLVALAGLVLVLGLGMTGCTPEQAPSPQAAPGQVANPNSIERMGPGSSVVNAQMDRLNRFRQQTFREVIDRDSADENTYDMRWNSVLYTAAVRHAGYLDSLNSENGFPGGDSENLTGSSVYDELRLEPTAPNLPVVTTPSQDPYAFDPVFPAFYTDPDTIRRIRAVQGGPDLLGNFGSSFQLNEVFVFWNQVPLETGIYELNSFWGYHNYDVIENMWYHRRGRLALMRADVNRFAIGRTVDARRHNNNTTPPFPSLLGYMSGTALTLGDFPNVPQRGYWPPNMDSGTPYDPTVADNINVYNIGLDTFTNGADNGDIEFYAGTPIHITIAADEHWSPNDFAVCQLQSVDGQGSVVLTGQATENTFGGGEATADMRVYHNVPELQDPALTGGGAGSFDAVLIGPAAGGGGGGTADQIIVPFIPGNIVSIDAVNGIVTFDITASGPLDAIVLPGVDSLFVFSDTQTFPAATPQNSRDDIPIIGVTVNTITVGPGIFDGNETPANPNLTGFGGNQPHNIMGQVVGERTTASGAFADRVRNGELLIVPVDPLNYGTSDPTDDPDSGWYRVAVDIQTVSYNENLDPGDPEWLNNERYRFNQEWWFRCELPEYNTVIADQAANPGRWDNLNPRWD